MCGKYVLDIFLDIFIPRSSILEIRNYLAWKVRKFQMYEDYVSENEK